MWNWRVENDTKFPRGYILLDVAICFIFHTNRTGVETNLVPKNWDYAFGSVINLLKTRSFLPYLIILRRVELTSILKMLLYVLEKSSNTMKKSLV